MDRRQLEAMEGGRRQAGGLERLTVGIELWEEWTGEEVVYTRWRQEQRRNWEARNRAQLRLKDRDVVYDRG